jgi:hypothetical protein
MKTEACVQWRRQNFARGARALCHNEGLWRPGRVAVFSPLPPLINGGPGI